MAVNSMRWIKSSGSCWSLSSSVWQLTKRCSHQSHSLFIVAGELHGPNFVTPHLKCCTWHRLEGYARLGHARRLDQSPLYRTETRPVVQSDSHPVGWQSECDPLLSFPRQQLRRTTPAHHGPWCRHSLRDPQERQPHADPHAPSAGASTDRRLTVHLVDSLWN